jgi:hypothetical protein
VSCGGHLGDSGVGVDAAAGGGADTDVVHGRLWNCCCGRGRS